MVFLFVCFFVIFFLHSVPSWYLPKRRGLWNWVHNIVLDNTGIGATQWSIKLNVRWQLTVGEIKCFGRQRMLKDNYYGLWPLHLRSDRRWWLSINTFTPISVLMAFVLRSSTVHQGSFYFNSKNKLYSTRQVTIPMLQTRPRGNQ